MTEQNNRCACTQGVELMLSQLASRSENNSLTNSQNNLLKMIGEDDLKHISEFNLFQNYQRLCALSIEVGVVPVFLSFS